MVDGRRTSQLRAYPDDAPITAWEVWFLYVGSHDEPSHRPLSSKSRGEARGRKPASAALDSATVAAGSICAFWGAVGKPNAPRPGLDAPIRALAFDAGQWRPVSVSDRHVTSRIMEICELVAAAKRGLLLRAPDFSVGFSVGEAQMKSRCNSVFRPNVPEVAGGVRSATAARHSPRGRYD